MKKIIIALTALLTMAVNANAMSYEQARQEALFLTDKMAYELNLTEDQYEAAYEINLDYLMSVDTRDDLYGTYWTRRNLDLSYILLDWQYNAYVAAQVTGTSEYMHAIRTAHISTSDTRTSGTPIVAATAGITMEAEAGITDVTGV